MKANLFVNWRTYKKIRAQAIDGMRFNDRRGQLICGLFVRVDVLSQDIIRILKADASAGCAPLLRCAFESYIDLKCLKEDEEYIYEFEALHVDSEIKYYKFYDEDNKYFPQIGANEAKKKVAALKDKKEELLAGRKKVMSIKDRFEKAGELGAYFTIYHTLSNFTHPSITALSSQVEGSNYVLNKKPHDSAYNFLFSSAINVACAALVETLEAMEHNRHFEKELLNNVERVNKKCPKGDKVSADELGG
ncbi:DUF5677 domain-containing protein [Chromohalobacter canadensis]|uniref:DUF5677 domain-containing protein n=1 Tax=Chromohalobacter canadensis TaxID=141389 RepID=A0ABZ0YCR5_9GAMM|nr:DUF5677 domain-containing protein [Chromohalobacter canadensis]MCK0770340.1 DUF5677 domain-containing protein [Chromohalobacter canadensis]WQH09498.1 DUF5677 domain-containing protein [Chromohalobacter canadensis]